MAIMETMEKNRKKRARLLILSVVFGLVFLGCVVWLIYDFVMKRNAQDQMEDIKNNYIVEVSPMPMGTPVPTAEPTSVPEVTPEPTATPSPTPEPRYPGLEGYDVPQKDIDFAALQKNTNSHIYAWLTVPGTAVDYPVLQHPEQIDYYLDHNLDHTTGYPGCVYSQVYNAKDWEDPITALYGHNMKDGSMFGTLHKYRDSMFFQENPYIYIYTEDGMVRVYQIYAAFEYTNADVVLMRLYGGDKTYQTYLDEIMKLDGMNNNYNKDIEVTLEDKVLTLVTCMGNSNYRYLVQGVMVAEGPAPEAAPSAQPAGQ